MTGEDASDEPLELPPEAAAELDHLIDERLETRGRIVELLAEDAGFGALADLSPAARRALEETVEEACEAWRVEPAAPGASLPAHERLLRHYHALGEAIRGVQDAVLQRLLGAGLAAEGVWRRARR